MVVSSLPESSSPRDQRSLISRSARQTLRIGALLGALCQPGDLVLLEGDLGAGKTALTQGIGAGLGIGGVINSPTFTLVKEYAGRLPLFHFDLYRLDEPAQVEDLGVEEYLERDGVCVVEWAERAAAIWPASWLRINMRITGARSRLLVLDAAGIRGHQLRSLLRAAHDASTDALAPHPDAEEMA